MAPHTLQAEADNRIAGAFLLVFALVMMLAPYIVSVVANIGRRPWPSRRAAVEAKPRALLSAPSSRIAA